MTVFSFALDVLVQQRVAFRGSANWHRIGTADTSELSRLRLTVLDVRAAVY
jgi:hypothetical protein